ncbi:STAS domain-containing protein [Kineococcus sp. SYSU DK002]|uniref:STAS domain-containing protein n=1 Tax=Kineococcus sp. SYSU DK002 TaxID=3383123 RepID=UPI003D7DA31E
MTTTVMSTAIGSAIGSAIGTATTPDPGPALRVQVLSTPSRRTVVLDGEFDVESAPLVQGTVQPLLGPGREVVLDLGRVTFCDVPACDALFACARSARDAGARLRLVHVRPFQRRVFALLELDALLPVDGHRRRVSPGGSPNAAR